MEIIADRKELQRIEAARREREHLEIMNKREADRRDYKKKNLDEINRKCSSNGDDSTAYMLPGNEGYLNKDVDEAIMLLISERKSFYTCNDKIGPESTINSGYQLHGDHLARLQLYMLQKVSDQLEQLNDNMQINSPKNLLEEINKMNGETTMMYYQLLIIAILLLLFVSGKYFRLIR